MIRTVWFAVCQVAFIPSNLRRGYGLREQWAIYNLARKIG